MAKHVKFYLADNTDQDSMISNALIEAGYIRKYDPRYGDFILDDGARGTVLEHFARSKPYFYVPHTPQSWFFFDWSRENTRTDCNFVNGNAAIFGMRAFGYLYRVEAIGFNRCEVREFTPTTGRDLLVIPAHAARSGVYTQPNYVNRAMDMLRFIISNRREFGKVTVCWRGHEFGTELARIAKRRNIEFVPTNPYKDASPLKSMMERMEQADLVMGCGTAGCVSVAIGRPTVFFSEVGVPYIIPGIPVSHPELYIDSLRFPLMAERMNINEILNVRLAENPRVRYWKQQVLGGGFKKDKFISIIKKILEHCGKR